jgi:surfeit locus 1 family protein
MIFTWTWAVALAHCQQGYQRACERDYLSRFIPGVLRGRRFRPSLAVTLATIGVIALTVSLGNWQHRRAEEKTALAREFDIRAAAAPVAMPASLVDAGGLEFRRVSAVGRFDAAKTFLLDNKVIAGQAGYHVITPFGLAGSELYMLVDLGWIPAGPSRDVLPEVPTSDGVQTIEGIAAVPSARFLELAPDRGRAVRQNLVIERIASEFHIALQPVLLQQTGPAADGLVRRWERPDTGVEKHVAYSWQWYSLAALAAVLYVVLNLQRNSRTPRA